MKNDKRVSIDWLSGTASNIEYDNEKPKFTTFIKDFLIYLKSDYVYDERDLVRGARYGYKYYLDVDEGIQIRFCGPKNSDNIPTWNLEITGKGCDKFNDKDWLNLFIFLFNECDFKCTRIDIPGDDLGVDYFSMKDLYEIFVVNKSYVLRNGATKISYIGTNDINQYKGMTFYIGSKTSDLFLRIYDKDSEQKDKLKSFNSKFPNWIRYEICFKNAYALEVIVEVYSALLKGESISNIWSSWMYKILKIKQVNENDLNKNRWKDSETYLKLLEQFKTINFGREKNSESSLEITKEWLETSAMKGLLKLTMAKGWEFLLLWLKNNMYNKIEALEKIDYIEVDNIRKRFGFNNFSDNDKKELLNQLQLTDCEFEKYNSYPYGWPDKNK